jgi:hypothetical protein
MAAVRVDFRAAVAKNTPCMTLQQVLAEADFLHTVIIDQFETLFTPAAKESFEPIKEISEPV